MVDQPIGSFVIDLWEFGAFIANSLIFLLIGLSLVPLTRVDTRAALALALALPHEILATAFGVVVFSVIVQGLTMPLLMRKLKLYNGDESIRRQP